MAIQIRKSTYRDRKGFLISGTDPKGRRVKIFAEQRAVAERIRAKVKAGGDIHTEDFKVNPPLVIFGNPGHVKLLGDVKAIVYRHADTDELMVHAFGPHGERIELTSRGDSLTIHHLPLENTRVVAAPNKNGTVTLASLDRKPLWQEFVD